MIAKILLRTHYFEIFSIWFHDEDTSIYRRKNVEKSFNNIFEPWPLITLLPFAAGILFDESWWLSSLTESLSFKIAGLAFLLASASLFSKTTLDSRSLMTFSTTDFGSCVSLVGCGSVWVLPSFEKSWGWNLKLS